MLKRLFLAAFISTATALAPLFPPPADAVLTAGHGISPAYQQQAVASLSDQIASHARRQAMSMGSVGYCYRGVKRALNAVGISLTGTAAYMAGQQLAQDQRFARVPLRNLKKGDILVHDRSAAHPYGHIAVYLGDGQEASDHVQKLVLGGRYGDTVVFRAHGTHCPSITAKAPAAPKMLSARVAIAHHSKVRNRHKSGAFMLAQASRRLRHGSLLASRD